MKKDPNGNDLKRVISMIDQETKTILFECHLFMMLFITLIIINNRRLEDIYWITSLINLSI